MVLMVTSTTLSQLRFAVPGGTTVTVALAVIAVLLIAFGIYELRELESPTRRRMLALLRIVSAMFALVCAVQPEWVVARVEEIPGRIAVLLDSSRSMLIRDGDSDRLSHAVERLQAFFDSARDKPALFTFGRDVAPIPRSALTAGLVPSDDTRMLHALTSLQSDQAADVGAVLLVSDGVDRGMRFEPDALKRLGVRIHTVLVGDAAARQDIAIQRVVVDGAAFLRQPVSVEVTLRSTPTAHDPVTLSLRNAGELIRDTTVHFDEHGEGSAKLTLIPEKLGRSAYSLSVATEPDDAVPENNERAFQLEVTREKLRVLLVSGHPNWDARFLRALLKSDPAVDLITFFILRTQNDNSMAPADELSLIPFPTEELFEQHLRSFDLIIFQDFDFAPYQMARYLPRIHDYVLEGGSFAMLGGDRSFGAGAYATTPIAEILPVKLPDHAPFTDEGSFAPQVPLEAAHHPVVELAPRASDSLAAWQNLSPLVGANLVQQLRPGAFALLHHPTLTTATGQPMPVLSVRSPGKGRTLALATDSSYLWGMATAGERGDASAYERIWDRALRWLSRDPLLDAARITTDRASYGPVSDMRVELLLRDELYRPLHPGPFRLAVQDDRGQRIDELSIETNPDGRATATLRAPRRPAAYMLGLYTEGSAAPLAEQGFVVEAGGDELADPSARPELLRQLAEATGGEYFASLAALPDAAQLPSSRAKSLGNETYSPFGSAWAFLALVVIFSLEWWLRRRAGLR
ncbi:MAG TPA: glutamine amidotransferase [Polyangiales bacterium]|nr:glutamine amidotransferase [Polyangiales bacterium]